MRILYHQRTQALDGQRVHIREIQDALRSARHEVVEVAAVSASEVAGGQPAPTLRRRVFGALAELTPKGAYEFLELTYNLVGYANLVRTARRFQPDVIYERYTLNTVAGVWAARSLDLPLLLEVNAPLAEEKEKLGRLFFTGVARKLENYVFRRADRLLPVTGVLAGMIAHSANVPKEKMVVIHNGVRPERFAFSDEERIAQRRKCGGDNDVIVGAVGFFHEWHGIDLLLECLIRNQDLRDRVRLVLVGDGPALPKLREQAAKGGIADRVRFTGSIPYFDVPPLVSAFDVVLLPSEYASPLKLFEYMAAGKAIIAARQENLLEVVTEGSDAVCFTPERLGELETLLKLLVNDEALRRRLGAEAQRTIASRGLTWEASAARIVKAAEELLEERASASRRSIERPGLLAKTGAER